ncbi:MAG: ester cyclase [Proteobacteria bacterium]|nr:ester cyclase [Pseudomonadota bacterium]
MQSFSSEFQTPEQYITDITYKIWEERGIGRIRDWYAVKGPVRTPHGVTTRVESVIQYTLETMHEFPDRKLLAEDIIIGDKAVGFLSSHRVRSTATHLGNGAFGSATNRPITMLAIADCLCRDNQVVEEWLLRDQADIARQLGHDPIAFGNALGVHNPDTYVVGNEALRERWADPDGLVIVGDSAIANQIINTYDAIWNGKNLRAMAEGYDRAVRCEGPDGHLCYGRLRTGDLYSSILASIPDGQFEPHHLIVRRQPEKAVRVALRWSYCGTHRGHGRYGHPTNSPMALLGISHYELRDGLIANEWMVVDETAIYAQMAAYQLA